MIVVDIEGTGLNPNKNSLLSIGAVDFINPNRQFYEECHVWDGAHIEEAALAVNGFTREQALDQTRKSDKEIVEDFLNWMQLSEIHTLAGHNTAFDRDFIQYTAERYHLNHSIPFRVIDLHSICYLHMVKSGLTPPVQNHRSELNSERVSVYAGLPIEPHPHNGLNGAKWEAEALSRLLYDKSFFEEFKKYPIPWVK